MALPSPTDLYPSAARKTAENLLRQAMQESKSDPAAHARVKDALDAWTTGWDSLAKLSKEEKAVNVDYNPELKKKK